MLLGDVVGSREVSDRSGVGAAMREACEAVNRRYEDAVVAPATLLKGVDEVGVVFDDRRAIYGVARTLLDGVHPVGVRFAVVEGEIDVGVDSGRVPAMDGPAFHAADDLLAAVADRELLFDAAIARPTLDRAVADEVNLLLRWRTELTERQLEFLSAYERRGTQSAAAEALGVTQQAVSKELRAVGWPFVSEIERRLETTLEEYEDVR